MSASNWAVCPTCRDAEKRRVDGLVERLATGYGQIPVEEYDALRAEVAKGVDEEGHRTFREDYEIYGAEKGTVTVDYSGHCQVCGAGLDFKDEHEVRS